MRVHQGARGRPNAAAGATGGALVPLRADLRVFGPEHLLLQRERKPGVPEWLWSAGFITVGPVWFSAWALWAWMYTAAAAGAPTATARSGRDRAAVRG